MKPGPLEETVVPEGEGPAEGTVTLRVPKKLRERIDRCAKETDNTRTDAILHLLRWALGQYEGNRDGVVAKKKGTA